MPTSIRESEVWSNVTDVTDVPLQQIPPVLTLVLERYLTAETSISPFQSYIEKDAGSSPSPT
jgi:hypothetical protein